MRLISQNRDYSFSLERTTFWRQDEFIYARLGKDSIVIGRYESEERAAEVFMEMHKAYDRCDSLTYYMPEV